MNDFMSKRERLKFNALFAKYDELVNEGNNIWLEENGIAPSRGNWKERKRENQHKRIVLVEELGQFIERDNFEIAQNLFDSLK